MRISSAVKMPHLISFLKERGFEAEERLAGGILVKDPVACRSGSRSWIEFKDVVVKANWSAVYRFLEARS